MLDTDWKDKRVEDAELLTPARLAALQERRPDVVTMGDLAKLTDLDLIRIPNFGRKTINAVREALATEKWLESLPSEEEVEARRAGFPADIWETVQKMFEQRGWPTREGIARALLDERNKWRQQTSTSLDVTSEHH